MSKNKYVKLQTTGIPVQYKVKGDIKAKQSGYGSLQDVIRLFVRMYARDEIDLNPIPKITMQSLTESFEEYKRGDFDSFDSIEEFHTQILKEIDEEDRTN